jgi:hypothetical protein
MTINLLYSALILCLIAAISIAIALISLFTKRTGIEKSMGVVALVSTVISFSIYLYLRIISGFSFSDWRVVFVVSVYAIACFLSVFAIVDGSRKTKIISFNGGLASQPHATRE